MSLNPFEGEYADLQPKKWVVAPTRLSERQRAVVEQREAARPEEARIYKAERGGWIAAKPLTPTRTHQERVRGRRAETTTDGDGIPNIAGGRVSSRFSAMRVGPTDGVPRPHNGVDIAAKTGARVPATKAGRVTIAGPAGSYGLAVYVVSTDGSATETRYGHLSRVLVRTGQRVKAGQVIGLVGSTGRSTGPHLHYEVRRYGKPINPEYDGEPMLAGAD